MARREQIKRDHERWVEARLHAIIEVRANFSQMGNDHGYTANTSYRRDI